MHRVRQSLPYYFELGWEPTVVCVNPTKVEAAQDELLFQSIPLGVRVIKVGAFSPKITRKFGLGNLGLRSLWFYWKRVNQLLKQEHFDLVFFSTTQFPVVILGNFWKKYFKIPYIVDIQDPWHSDYYLSKPKSERPPKFWFSYRLNKYLEFIAMNRVDAIISVSEPYYKTLCQRYPHIDPKYCHTITFGAFEKDFEIAQFAPLPVLPIKPNEKTIIYVGRGGYDMQMALKIVFNAFILGLKLEKEKFGHFKFFFLGTSYAPDELGQKTISPLAFELGIGEYVFEQPNRVPYFQALRLLQDADLLLIPGSDDPQYTASKIYPYILAKRPIISVFQEQSSAAKTLQQINCGIAFTFTNNSSTHEAAEQLYFKWSQLLNQELLAPVINESVFATHLAFAKTKQQVEVFNQVMSNVGK